MEHKEEINIQPEQKAESRIQKNEDNIRRLGHRQMCQHPNHRGARRRQEEQEIENLLEKIMKENFPNLVKELDIQVLEAQNPKQVGPKEDHTKTHHN